MAVRPTVLIVLLILIAQCGVLIACDAAPLFATPAPDEPYTRPSQADTAAVGPVPKSTVDRFTPTSSPFKTTPTPHPVTHLLKDLGPAPALSSLEWINAEPIRLTDLRGQVVMIEFWSYG
jgi:hypothetical protein